jgi:hypothetical protein
MVCGLKKKPRKNLEISTAYEASASTTMQQDIKAYRLKRKHYTFIVQQ